jgi:hypothetical protein
MSLARVRVLVFEMDGCRGLDAVGFLRYWAIRMSESLAWLAGVLFSFVWPKLRSFELASLLFYIRLD